MVQSEREKIVAPNTVIQNDRILVVDDDRNILKVIKMRAEAAGFEVTAVDGIDAAVAAATDTVFDLALVDLKLAEGSGIDLMEQLHRINPEMPVIILTAFGTIDSAVEAMRKGAYGYLTKPFDYRELLAQINASLDRGKLLKEVRRLRDLVNDRYDDKHVIGNSEKMKQIISQVAQAAQSDSSIYIEGESGTGKELIARMVHAGSPRKDQSFVTINCAALPETLWESELFGYKKGAFTGAACDRQGLFSLAHGGTFFLDEISEMPLPMQTKLLRVLQEREFYPLGSRTICKVDARLIATSNKELKKEVELGNFREDLFYRIYVIVIKLPPLRERKEDILTLAKFFLKQYTEKTNKEIKGFSSGAIQKMMSYDWPGNVRELKNEVERAVVMAVTDIIGEGDVFQMHTEEVETLNPLNHEVERLKPLKQAKADFEKQYLFRLIELTGGNISKAAELSGKYRADLYELMKKYDLKPSDFRETADQ